MYWALNYYSLYMSGLAILFVSLRIFFSKRNVYNGILEGEGSLDNIVISHKAQDSYRFFMLYFIII